MERGPSDKLAHQEIEEGLSSLPGWSFNGETNMIEKTFTRQNFVDAVNFIQDIAEIAEAQDHHPDIFLHKYKNVKVMLTTHSAGGVTQNDLDVATAIEAL